MKHYLLKITVILCAFLIFSCSEDSSDSETEITTEETSSEQSIEEEILRLVNEHRQSKGLSPLENNEIAHEIAVEHTNYMISINEINHDNFDDRFQQLREEVKAVLAGENVASGHPTPRAVVDGWLNSQGHRENIERDFTHSGIAAIKNEGGRYYYTQLFYRKQK